MEKMCRMLQLFTFACICSNTAFSFGTPKLLDPELELWRRRARIAPPKPNVYKCRARPQLSSGLLPSCHPNPCKNGGVCINEGASTSCRCPIEYAGKTCDKRKGECVSYGDPHYLSFNKQRFDFMGRGFFVLSEDCKDGTFKIEMKNDYCGTRTDVTCLHEILIRFKGNAIRLYRGSSVISLNYKKFILTCRPMCGHGFILRRLLPRRVILTTDFGVEVEWNGDRTIRVFVLEKFKGKTCGLCGNYGVNDNNCGAKGKCNENAAIPGFCRPGREDIVKMCDLMLHPPFQACNSKVSPSNYHKDCKFDACRCDNPWHCVCSAFSTYSKDCADNDKVLSWRNGGNAYQPLAKCAKTCSPQQVFTECGSSCEKTCRDLSSTAPCNEECVAECQCPSGQLLDDKGSCIARQQCPCHYEKKIMAPGDIIKKGDCEICICKSGLIRCKDACIPELKPKPCDSSPCKNGGTCTNIADTFSCKCTDEYQGPTCAEMKPKPCGSSPCQNGGTCTNVGNTFSCNCTDEYRGPTCAEMKPKPCDSSPCKNSGMCTNVGKKFSCNCTDEYQGPTCAEMKPKPCDSSPCQNSGTCRNVGNTFSCNCTDEYQGPTCAELKPKPCDSSPCKNGGTCRNVGDSFSCNCTDEYQGPFCAAMKPKPCDSSPCQNGGTCTNIGKSYSCNCTDEYQGRTCKEPHCDNTKVDLLYVVDGSGSVRKANFAKIKEFIQQLNSKFDVGPTKTQIALLQFGEPNKTRIEFNLGEKNTKENVNQGVVAMKYLRSQTATGDALKKAREQVFNGKGGDRPDAGNILILFTDGQATDKQGKTFQVEEAQKLKNEGVMIITVGMGQQKTISRFRHHLRQMASKPFGKSLEYESDFESLQSISNMLLNVICVGKGSTRLTETHFLK